MVFIPHKKHKISPTNDKLTQNEEEIEVSHNVLEYHLKPFPGSSEDILN